MTLLKTAFLTSAFLAALAVGDGFLGVYLAGDEPVVTSLVPDSAAAKADIRVGDRFLSVDGTDTPTRDDFMEVMQRYDAGAQVSFAIQRRGEKIEKTVTLGKRPDEVPPAEEVMIEAEPPAKAQAREEGQREEEKAAEGLRSRAQVEGEAQEGGRAFLGVSVEEGEDGVAVAEVVPDGPAERGGVKPGDILVGIGRTEQIRSHADLVGALGKLRPGQTVRVKIARGDETETLSVTLGARAAEGEEAQAQVEAGEKTEGEPRRAAKAEGGAAGAAQAEKRAAQAAKEKKRAEQAAKDAEERAARTRARAERSAKAAAERQEPSGDSGELGQLRVELRELREEIAALKDLVRKLAEQKTATGQGIRK